MSRSALMTQEKAAQGVHVPDTWPRARVDICHCGLRGLHHPDCLQASSRRYGCPRSGPVFIRALLRHLDGNPVVRLPQKERSRVGGRGIRIRRDPGRCARRLVRRRLVSAMALGDPVARPSCNDCYPARMHVRAFRASRRGVRPAAGAFRSCLSVATAQARGRGAPPGAGEGNPCGGV